MIIRTAFGLCAGILCAVTFFACPTILDAADAHKHGDALEQAQKILKDTGITGGVIVHLGCGDGQLTAALRAGDSFLVHGLDADALVTAAELAVQAANGGGADSIGSIRAISPMGRSCVARSSRTLNVRPSPYLLVPLVRGRCSTGSSVTRAPRHDA